MNALVFQIVMAAGWQGQALRSYRHKTLSDNQYDGYTFCSLPRYSVGALSYRTPGIKTKYLMRYGMDEEIVSPFPVLTSSFPCHGAFTGTAAAILDDDGDTLYSCLYYDKYHRLIQGRSTNSVDGMEAEFIAYNFVNQPVKRKHIHTKETSPIMEEYTYTYDNLSRLTTADYREAGVASDKFGAAYSYDRHGNILNLRRHGNKSPAAYGLVDNVTFTYVGNWLVKADDAIGTIFLSASRDFKDTVDIAIEYAYDANGNMTMDGNNGIYSIAYNLLNLPKKVTFAEPGVSNEYVYSADGTKLSVLHKKASTEERTDYVGNMIYKNDSLDIILVDGGYIKNGQYHFYLQDHLGSNRVVADANGNITQVNHYYPYGTPFAESYSSDIQKYKYIGKEYDTDNGLDWYDVKARMMDGLRFTTMDPLAEKYYSISPYAYVAGNPVNRFDLRGDSIWFTSQYSQDGSLTGLTMHVTGRVLNDSGNNINMKSATKNITSAIQRAYDGDFDGITFETDVQLSEAKSMDEVSDSDHLFVLTDKFFKIQNGEIYGASNYSGGKVAFIDADFFSGPYDTVLGSRNYGSFTAAHEFGHLLGLGHEKKNSFNIMRSGGMFYKIKSSQLRAIYSNWAGGQLNVGTNYMRDLFGKKRPNIGSQMYVRPW
jgi:RHS repeat-associated protein